MGSFGELMERLDANSAVRRGRQFELVCQWFLTHYPMYSGQLRRVWLWDEWPGRWGIDAGIDLVAEDNEGRLWAVQAKCYDQSYRVTKKDVNRFLAEAGRPIFDYRLLIATTNRMDKIAERTIRGQGTASVVNLADLEAAELNWPTGPDRLTTARPIKRKKPRPHQREAISDVIKGFQHNDRGQLIMACGTGKTLASLFIKERLAAERTLVLFPSLSLLRQTLREWTTNRENDFQFMAVCSDDTVVGDDAAVAYTSDLGIPVTTDPARIAGFLRRRSGARVVFATYQSSAQIAKAYEERGVPQFDLVVADEAHRCAGPVSSDFATVLNADRIKAKRRLFMTATPRYFTGRLIKEAKEAEYEIASMDNEEAFGPVLHKLPFSEAINRDLLTDYQVVVVGVDDATYRDWAERGELVVLDGGTPLKTDARSLAGQIGLAKAMRKYDLHRTITFHSRVHRARHFAASMPHVLDWMPARQRPRGRLWSDYASGEMTAGDREIRLRHLATLDEGERGLLANARCLAEGVDVPTLDGVAFIDPRRSEVDIVQAVGRAIRRSENKTVGTIVIPVFIADEDDPQLALDDSAFKPVWDVIKALRSHDEELGEQLDELRRSLGRTGKRIRLPDKIHLDIPAKVGADFAAAFDVRLVERTTVSWEFWFGLLQSFADETGHARVNSDFSTDGYRLGAWVANQRAKYGRNTLSAHHVEMLESVAGWTWDPVADYWIGQWAEQWEEGFRHLTDFVKRQGDARVPSELVDDDGYRLGWWTIWQRTLYRDGELDADRVQRLSRLPGWSWDVRTDQWEQGFAEVARWAEKNGHARVPRGLVVGGFPVGSWVRVQRREFTRGTLRADRRDRLEALRGWTWDPFTDAWEDGFSRLAEYVKDNGDARVPRSEVVDGFGLGGWVKRQRRDFNAGRLNADRQARLEALPGWTWDPYTDQWEDGFRRLSDYAARHGDARVPHTCIVDGFRLGTWVQVQRRKYTKVDLDETRQRRLEALPGWKWEAMSDKWEAGFEHLVAYVSETGDARASRWSVAADGYRLGAWINQQRNVFKAGRMTAEREARLRELPGWTFDSREADWDEGYSFLVSYVAANGTADTPSDLVLDGYKLGVWVCGQRAAKLKGTLDGGRERRLEALPGWTWNSKASRWDEFYSLLQRYAAANGNVRVSHDLVVDGRKLGVWVIAQRANFKQGVLNPERVHRLEQIPGWTWDRFADQWEQAFRLLCDYVKQHGDAQVPYGYSVDGVSLGSWIRKQRAVFNRGGGDPSRRERLESLPGWSWSSAGRVSNRRPS